MTGAITRGRARVSVVVPTWNAGRRFDELLEALDAQDVDGGCELVVVDSGSSDGTAHTAARAGAFVFQVPQAEFNHGRTRNLAIERTRGEYVALLTQDAVPLDASYLSALVAALDETGADGGYARQFPRPDCDPLLAERLRQWSASRDERTVQELARGDAEASRARFDELTPLERYLTCAFDDVASVLRRTSWEREPLPHRQFGEDVAWARATLLAGGAVVFEPTARVEHSHRLELRREFDRLYADHRNLVELFDLRNVPTWGDVWRGWHHQRRFYRELLATQELPRLERLQWRAIATVHALSETTAQFLGARSHWKASESRLWAAVDRRVRGNV